MDNTLINLNNYFTEVFQRNNIPVNIKILNENGYHRLEFYKNDIIVGTYCLDDKTYLNKIGPTNYVMLFTKEETDKLIDYFNKINSSKCLRDNYFRIKDILEKNFLLNCLVDNQNSCIVILVNTNINILIFEDRINILGMDGTNLMFSRPLNFNKIIELLKIILKL